MRNPHKNSEGYSDPTAYAGLKSVIRDDEERQKKVNSLIYVLKFIVQIAGFELLNRIELKDLQTGRDYR